MRYAKTCERCGNPFETFDRLKRICCHHATGNKKHGLSFSKENDIWRQMRYRCNSPKCKHYPLYGGRGIRVCERWGSFENFLADMGPKPPGRSLDRIDTNGDYEPSNCRWATPLEQTQNRRPFSEWNTKRRGSLRISQERSDG